jgi:hypothetical protein
MVEEHTNHSQLKDGTTGHVNDEEKGVESSNNDEQSVEVQGSATGESQTSRALFPTFRLAKIK